ncbi:MAG: hypothetical protein K2O90_04250, partial [Limosilactobacillus sp.]|nr:hypothetical protein [Limosilactobacillus sp.]
YKTKLVSAIISVIIFGIVSIFFDLPTWRVDKTNYELTDRGKIYKFYSQTSVIATATGIAWWQNVPIQIIESSKPCAIELLIGLVVIIALSLEFIMGITLFLFNKGWLNTIYKKKESK